MKLTELKELHDIALIEYLDKFVTEEITKIPEADKIWDIEISDDVTEIMITEKNLENLEDGILTLTKINVERNDGYVEAILYNLT